MGSRSQSSLQKSVEWPYYDNSKADCANRWRAREKLNGSVQNGEILAKFNVDELYTNWAQQRLMLQVGMIDIDEAGVLSRI